MRSTADTFVKDLIAGGVSGIVAKTIGKHSNISMIDVILAD